MLLMKEMKSLTCNRSVVSRQLWSELALRNMQTDKKFGHRGLKKAMNFHAVCEDNNSVMEIIENYLSTYTVRA